MKKRIIIPLIAVLLLGIVPLGTITVFAQTESREVTIKGPLFTNSDGTVDLTLPLNFDWLTKNDNTQYESGLAAFSAVASADAYYREKDEGTASENKVLIRDSADPYDCTAFLSAYGFEDVCRIETYDKNSTDIDKNDSATFLAGHRLIDGTDVFIFVFRGVFSSGEWLSAFETGDPETVGEHPNWTNPDNLKGIDVAANAAAGRIEQYVSEYGDESAPDSILLTGHSRGGAIANVLGAKFEKEAKAKSYTYTFSAPRLTVAEDAADYKTIFNVNNTDDYFENFMPFGEETLVRYGIDLQDSFSESEELAEQLKAFGPAGEYASVPAEVRERYRALFAGYFPNRTDIYKTSTETLTFENEADAQAKYDACVTVINGFKLDDLCRVELEGNKVRLTTAKASLLKSYSMVMAYGTTDMVNYVKTLFPEDQIAQLLYDNLADLTNAHRILKSFVLCKNVKPEEPEPGPEPEPEEEPEEKPENEPEEKPENEPEKEPEKESEKEKLPQGGDTGSAVLIGMLLAAFAAALSAFRLNRQKRSRM